MTPQIDLFEPAQFPPPPRPPLAWWLGVLALLAVVALWRVGWAMAHWRSAGLGTAVAAEPTEDADPLAVLRTQVLAAEALAASSGARPPLRWEVLPLSADVFAALPPSVWLQRLHLESRGVVTIDAAAADASDVERFARALSRIGSLRDSPVSAVQVGRAGQGDADDSLPQGFTRLSWTIDAPVAAPVLRKEQP